VHTATRITDISARRCRVFLTGAVKADLMTISLFALLSLAATASSTQLLASRSLFAILRAEQRHEKSLCSR
jgi:hypothetical protein